LVKPVAAIDCLQKIGVLVNYWLVLSEHAEHASMFPAEVGSRVPEREAGALTWSRTVALREPGQIESLSNALWRRLRLSLRRNPTPHDI
jgi:hypothetical protein